MPSGRFLTAEERANLQLLEHEPQASPQPELIAEPYEEPAAPDVVDEVPAESTPEPPPEPVQEPDPVLQRARALGYEPLPRRPQRVW